MERQSVKSAPMRTLMLSSLAEATLVRLCLLASLTCAFFCFFVVNSHLADYFMALTGFLLMVQILKGEYLPTASPTLMAVGGICLYLATASLVVTKAHHEWHYVMRLLKMLGVVFAIHSLGREGETRLHAVLFGALLGVSICWQSFALHVLAMPFGVYSNPHYLAILLILALPFIFYFSWVNKGWLRGAFVLLCLLALELLLQTSSRPAFIALTAGALFVFALFTKGRYRWLGLALVFGLFTAVWLTDYAGMETRLKDLAINLPTEERVLWWQDAWRMQKDSSAAGWLFGNGIGSVQRSFPDYISPDYGVFYFPHNYFLQLLYEDGAVGLVLVFGGFCCLLVSLIKVSRTTIDRRLRLVTKCTIAAFLSWSVHGGITFPFYSKYSLYPLAFLLGATVVLIERGKTEKAPPGAHGALEERTA